MITRIDVSFNYGYWNIWFSKDFELDFTPFYGMWFLDKKDGIENDIEFANNNYCSTMIYYSNSDKTFNVEVRNNWKYPVRDDVVDDIIEKFVNTGWERNDNTNIVALKELMNRDYELSRDRK